MNAVKLEVPDENACFYAFNPTFLSRKNPVRIIFTLSKIRGIHDETGKFKLFLITPWPL